MRAFDALFTILLVDQSLTRRSTTIVLTSKLSLGDVWPYGLGNAVWNAPEEVSISPWPHESPTINHVAYFLWPGGSLPSPK